MQRKVLKLDPRDNVLIALADIRQGQQIEFEHATYELVSDVPAKHKFAAADLTPGGEVIMYGVLVGKAMKPIRRGEIITPQNLHHEAAPFREKSKVIRTNPPDVSRWCSRTFLGYRRADGQTGTRNHWLVVPLVFCENRNIAVLKQAFEEELGFAAPQIYRQQVAEFVRLYREGRGDEIRARKLQPSSRHDSRRDASGAAAQGLPVLQDESPGRAIVGPRVFEHLDGIKFLMHEGGCGGTREDARNLCGLIAGYIHHPNVAGATILSLGCQHSQIAILREEIAGRNPRFDKPLVILEQQQTGSEEIMLTEAIRQTFLGLMQANQARRTEAPLSQLCVGLKCGGSDGFSGLSANPSIGHT